ncbi:MAG: diaminopimelate decarboxylase [Candidatus Eremiobacteraeota bacterium]|nr:diaminopimelate decarboxylase [Candidatus Eremiobacteraeota bacterium]
MRVESAAGELRIGGTAAAELAAAYGTPLLAIDTDVLDANLAHFAALGARHGLDVAYAGKALLFVALARRIARSPLALDVCSLGELLTGETAGMPGARMVLHGCGKTDEELQAAIDGRVGRIVVDNFEELERLAKLAHARCSLRVLLRVNTGIEAHTHAYVRTGGEESKFGFPVDRLSDAIARCSEARGLALGGIHSHLGSQIFEGSAYAASLPIALDALAQAVAGDRRATDLVLGGGFGIDARPAGERFDFEATLEELARDVATGARARGIATPRLGIEPGRALVAEAGTSLYRVVAVKRQGARHFAVVDGGMADNPRPALYGAYHHPLLADRVSRAQLVDTTVCGRSCENDRLVVAPLPADLAAGDLLALGTTGAYTYSMASNYNRFTKPAIAFAGGRAHRLVVRRETSDEVLRYDVLDAD